MTYPSNLLAACMLLCASSGCMLMSDHECRHGLCSQGGSSPEAPACGPDTEGPVATNAYQAWKDRPSNVPVMTAQQMLEACSIAGACSPDVMQLDLPTRMLLVDMCLSDLVFAGERAIPLSGLSSFNERAEYWVGCVLGHQDDCAVVPGCRTGRDPAIDCQEDGCRTSVDFAVTCSGTVATLEGDGRTAVRDCALAYADCSTDSPTGCTDRHFSRCAEEPPLPDRCDGDIRLGCDGVCQVSYHDCSRMGGTCGTTTDGEQGCVYPGTPSAECTTVQGMAAACTGSVLSACVNGQRLSLPSTLCQGS